MLTDRHLVVIGAALRFWDEEMSPYGDKMFVDYVEGPDRLPNDLILDVKTVRELIGKTELAYLMVNADTNALLSKVLIRASDAYKLAHYRGPDLIASVLIPKREPV